MTRAVIQIKRNSDPLAALTDMTDRFFEAWESGAPSDPAATITFNSAAQLFTIFTAKRWELIETLQKIGPSSIRGLARTLDRDVKRVHEDVSVMMEWHVIHKDDGGKIFVPYDKIEADFALEAAA